MTISFIITALLAWFTKSPEKNTSMTIASATSRISYVGNGATTAFAVPFYFQANADLVVYLQSSTGTQTLQVLGTHYNLTGATLAAGGTCTFVTAPTATTGAVVTIYRDPAITQTTDYNNNDPFPASSHELALDKLTTIDQRTRDMVGRAIHINDGEAYTTVTALESIANRKNKLLGFGTSGELTYPLGPTYVAGTYVGVAEVDSRASAQATTFTASITVVTTQGFATPGDGGGANYIRGLVSDSGAFADAGGTYWKPDLSVSPINAGWFGAKGDGVTDDSTAIQAAITAAAGRPVVLNAGTFVVGTALTYSTAGSTQWMPGLHLSGAGPGKTFIDNRVAGPACITSQSTVANKFQLGGWIRDMTIMTTTVATTGIMLKATYQFTVENVHITGMAGNGGQIDCLLGDADGANVMLWKNCRFELCGGAGLLCNFAAGVVQVSFVTVEDCFFSGNTLAGYYYMGLAGSLINCAFATNVGPGLWMAYSGVSNSSFYCAGTVWENNAGALDAQLRIDNLVQGSFIGCEFASTSLSFPAVTAVWLAPAGNAVRGVRFQDTRFRISAGFTPYTGFKLAATTSICSFANSIWVTYDAAGQVRYEVNASAYGNRMSDLFDAVQVGQSNGLTTIVAVNGANQNFALPLDGTTFGISGPTGAFNFGGFVASFGAGDNGRRLELINRSGFAMTLNHEDAGSTAANRINAAGAANVVVANLGTATLRYYGPSARWQVIGTG